MPTKSSDNFCNVKPIHLRDSVCNHTAVVILHVGKRRIVSCLPCAVRMMIWHEITNQPSVYMSKLEKDQVIGVVESFYRDVYSWANPKADLNYVEDLTPFVTKLYYRVYRQRLADVLEVAYVE